MFRIINYYRRALVLLVHIALWAAALIGALLLRFDFSIPVMYVQRTPLWLLELAIIRTVFHQRAGLFHQLWRYSSARDLLGLLKATLISSMLFAIVALVLGPPGLPRSVLFIEGMLAVCLTGGLRLGIRMVRETSVKSSVPEGQRRRVLIVGAGDAGEMLMREIMRTHQQRYEPVGFLDDSPLKHGARLHGVMVLGPISQVGEFVRRERVDEIVIAVPSITGKEMRRIVDLCAKAGAHTRMLPGVDKLNDAKTTLQQLQPVRIEDLLGREPVVLDQALISSFLRGKKVLVTGAGGSIGSELCRQIAYFAPSKIVLLEQAENSLFRVHQSMIAEHPSVHVVPCIADICDTRRLRMVFENERPDVVFHAAAHKHVPMMEWNPGEALKNNVFGTRKVADFAAAYNVDKFVMVSTDKAVNPTSVMGACKRVAEIYVQALSQRCRTHFVTVRFGNVLGSDGSVIPTFKEQISKGGPITVTHPEMTRYFMTIPEACQLVMQAGSMGNGGEIFILDMGEPVKVVDLAHSLIRLSGLVPGEDIDVKFTGLRQGEKLFEELSTDEESADKTVHPKIFVGRFKPNVWEEIERGFAALHDCTDSEDQLEIKSKLRAIVPEYTPSASRPARPERERKRTASRELVEVSENLRTQPS